MIPELSAHLKGPFYDVRAGLSREFFGEIIHDLKTKNASAGRYPVVNGNGATFHIVLYEDLSWRISTPQLEIFPGTTLT